MNPSRRPRIEGSDRACLQCQRRKTKCVTKGHNASCVFCAKTGRRCIFGEPLARTSLTRKNLDEAESRCKALEAQLRRLQSGQDPEASLRNGSTSQEPDNSENPTPGAEPDSNGRKSVETPSTRDFEWHETFSGNFGDSTRKDGRDGMASLAADINDSGYLGVLRP